MSAGAGDKGCAPQVIAFRKRKKKGDEVVMLQMVFQLFQ